MKRPLIVLGVLLALAIATTLLRHRSPLPRSSGPFPQQVYVWQQAWTPGVRDAVGSLDPSLDTTVLLAAVVHWDGASPADTQVPIDLSVLKDRPFAIAIRFGSTPPTADKSAFVVGVVQRALQRLSRAPVEVQIDYDCPESKLAGYRNWIAAIQSAVKPVPVAITALPSWLKSRRAFDELANQCPFILQVHSLYRPTASDAPWQIIDPAAAMAAVEQAAKFGKPFRVALPTIGYAIATDKQTNKQTVFGENLPEVDPEKFTVRPIRTDAVAMAALIRQWQADRPAAMTGVIWYRLPVESDALNWRPATFDAVRKGQTPAAVVAIAAVRKNGLVELALTNTGTADAPLPAKLTLDWTGDAPIASDYLHGYRKLDQTTSSITLLRDESAAGDPIAVLSPGSRIPIGWIRFPKDTEVCGHVTPSP